MKRLLIFNLLIVVFTFNFLKGSDPISRRVRHVIMNRSKPQQVIAPIRSNNDNSLINKFPFEINNELCSYLDFKSLLNLKNTCKRVQNEVNKCFKLTINQICPECVLQDSFVNGLLHLILKENIPPSISVNDPEIYDYLALMIIKFISDDYFPKDIPRLVYHHILQYLFEIIYESDESIPVYEDTWRNWLVFKLQKYSLPRTLDYFIEIKRASYDRRLNWNFDQWKELLEFVATRPHAAAQRRFLKENNLYSHISVVTLPQEFSCFFFDTLHNGIVSDESVPLIFSSLLCCNHMSKSLFERLNSADSDEKDILFKNLEIFTHNRDLKFKQFIVEKYKQKCDPVWYYIWSRDEANNPFDPDELLKFDFNAFELLNDILITKSPKLVHIEIFSFLVRTLEFEEIGPYDDNLVQYLSEYTNDLYWDILLNESKTTVNLFYSSGSGIKFHFYNNEFRSPYSTYERNIRIFVKSLSKEHPLPLLFAHVTVLEKAKDLILDKFNLNQKYFFDESFKEFSFANINEELKEQFEGQVLRFIDILRLINNERLNEIFISSFDQEISETETLPIYSVSKFLNFAIFEEI